MDFKGRDVLSLLDFSREDIEQIFKLADKLEYVVNERRRLDILKDKILGILFFEASTRTRLSFESAMLRLGGGVTGFADAAITRVGDRYKETLADTARVVENYVDIIAIRHYENGVPGEVAKYVDIPVINAGDGSNEHPTQGLLDLYTIKKTLGGIDDIEIVIISDMRRERVIPSLLYGLARFGGVKVHLLGPKDLRLQEQVLKNIKRLHLDYDEIDSISEVIHRVDVVYSNVIKRGRGEPKTSNQYVVNEKIVEKAKEEVIIMHPLPRLDELGEDVDILPNSKYFEETKYGVVIRMAILCLLFGRQP